MDPRDPLTSGYFREHHWREYDEHHRACDRCGLRVFRRKHQNGELAREWVMMDWRGVPSPPLLGSSGGGFGSCKLPPKGFPVLIEYTGDPDVYPGCERIMHRAPEASSSSALLDLGSLRPVCGWRCQFWELGPSREWHGWNWCADCYPEYACKCEKLRHVSRRGNLIREDRVHNPLCKVHAAPELPRRTDRAKLGGR